MVGPPVLRGTRQAATEGNFGLKHHQSRGSGSTRQVKAPHTAAAEKKGCSLHLQGLRRVGTCFQELEREVLLQGVPKVGKSVTLGKCLRALEWGILNAGIWGGYRDRSLPCKSQSAQLDNGVLLASFLSAFPCLLSLIISSTVNVEDWKARIPANKGD